ncbi:transcriptional regulator, ArgR family [Tangfeifania diversioriginum]|uniref:Arginine repressor n=1 Tax=Tangfeifania diversioriginum TaxID=1168035 RepID=A0A1M6KTP0_9BACT|nr:ArgR family transcriptional regulator [Tangfeifania diversioriginum]SHJ62224.1 transcriptional regulator, ArgR family [Tangfeifania diversioriginum]
MKNRVQRQLEIRKIISKGKVRSQEELLAVLKHRGYDLTQATLSRDLKFLQVAKVPHPVRGYVYEIPENGQNESRKRQVRENYLADGFMSLQFSGNLAVMKTLPGYASSLAVVIDSARKWEILATVAGDDTILVIQREGTTKNDLINALVSIMPKLKNKL